MGHLQAGSLGYSAHAANGLAAIFIATGQDVANIVNSACALTCFEPHPDGLYVRGFRTEEGVLSPVIISRRYEGPPGAAHGGIIAAYMDEILGAAAFRGTGKIAVTGELTVRYAAPAPLETPLLGRGRLIADHGRYIEVEGSLEELASAKIVSTARGRFFPVKRH